jgi:hypothetical protein
MNNVQRFFNVIETRVHFIHARSNFIDAGLNFIHVRRHVVRVEIGCASGRGGSRFTLFNDTVILLMWG